MQSTNDEVLDIFRSTGALLQGHFILRSGLRSEHFFQCAQVCQHMAEVTRLIELLKPRLEELEFKTVLAPAMGGLVVGQEVARQFNARYIFVEKENDRLVLRRGFKIEPDEPILIVEDVITPEGGLKRQWISSDRMVETLPESRFWSIAAKGKQILTARSSLFSR